MPDQSKTAERMSIAAGGEMARHLHSFHLIAGSLSRLSGHLNYLCKTNCYNTKGIEKLYLLNI